MPRRRRPHQQLTPSTHYNSGIVDWQGGSLEEQDYRGSNEPLSSLSRTPTSHPQLHAAFHEAQEFYHSYPVQHATTASVRGRSNSRGRRSSAGVGDASISQSRSRSRSQSDTASDSNTGMSILSKMDLLTRVGNRAIALSRSNSASRSTTDENERMAYADRMISFSLNKIRQSCAESCISRVDASNSETSISTDIRGQALSSTSPSSPTSISSSGAQMAQNMPQNLRGDPFRSAKIKTELCRNFMSGRGCIFGDKCNYAHGEHELKYTTLLDLQSAGLVDICTFRTHPCPTWVSTGSCPFDLRCPFLHDPRIVSKHASWLPHAETEVNSIDTDVNVDRLYHQRTRSAYSNTPFIEFQKEFRNWTSKNHNNLESVWMDFYAFVCNINASPQNQIRGATPKNLRMNPLFSQKLDDPIMDKNVLEFHRVAIAIELRERKLGVSFIYRPTHVIFGELCMILQSRAFRICEANTSSDVSSLVNLDEVTLPPDHINVLEQEEPSTFDFGYDNHLIVAHEIAFGPVCDPSSRQLSICFNVPMTELSKCTPQQAKRHKRSRNRNHRKGSKERALSPTTFSSSHAHDARTDVDDRGFETQVIPPFFENQPNDKDAFQLVSDILSHRARQLFSEYAHPIDPEVHESINEMEKIIKIRFECQLRFWLTWAWPGNLGSDEVDKNTQIPPVSGQYRFSSNIDNRPFRINYSKLATGFVWISFVMNFLKDPYSVLEKDEIYFMPNYSELFAKLPRLPTLRSLSLGKSLSSYHSLFTIKGEVESKQIHQNTLKHCVCSFKTLFDYFDIVQNHYSLRNTYVDDNEDNEGSSESIDSHPSKKSNYQPDRAKFLSDPASWTRLHFSS